MVPEHRMAYVASYGAGTWSSVPLQAGEEQKLLQEEQREQFGAGCRNNTSHPHHTVSLGTHVWVVDLGKQEMVFTALFSCEQQL